MKCIQKIFAITIFSYLHLSLFGQNRTEYCYYDKNARTNFRLNVYFNQTFDFHVGNTLSSSSSFGELVKIKGNWMLKSKLQDFKLEVSSKTNALYSRDSIKIQPLIYQDSSIESSAYAIIDGDFVGKKYLDTREGLMISNLVKSLKIEIKSKYYTESVSLNRFVGNEFYLVVRAPFPLDDFLNISDGFFFRKQGKGRITVFDSSGKLLFTMRKCK